ncbi:protein CHLOROPLAST ENHANCING STRESS TOLERANCE, chloroplastic-like isoform X2 [Selaginella moellendorffii]|nr:protein CHLOROPLAST ENHANCING STRESS TOLERANCE, chloroplastic-like isoform X2 [Selaginella moellendorffii]|eukprot:XP_024520339.1 protein CHLOROPLAST ENHANCING STRESS TOLERANCE, chloroplastic-like isoform X2 [Selaginella moellendorffii]
MRGLAALDKEEGSSPSSVVEIEGNESDGTEESAGETVARDLTPEEEEDQECVDQILRILELLRINRDMTPNEVRLVVMIEDPREAETAGVLTEDGEWTSYRDEMGNALIDISEGRIPDDRELLRALRNELLSWPNLEEMADKRDPRQSSYAQITDTGVDPVFAGKRAKVDAKVDAEVDADPLKSTPGGGWDEAAEIIPGKEKDMSEKLPPAFGYSLLYLVSLLPILIGVAVVAILFFNSFQ